MLNEARMPEALHDIRRVGPPGYPGETINLRLLTCYCGQERKQSERKLHGFRDIATLHAPLINGSENLPLRSGIRRMIASRWRDRRMRLFSAPGSYRGRM